MIFRFILCLPVWFIGTFILSWPLVPVAVLLADKNGRLPKLFRWLETHDDPGFGALDQEPVVEQFAAKWGKRIGLMRWLWRNKAYTLRYRMGIPFHDSLPVPYRVIGVQGSLTPAQRGPSALWVVVEANGRRYFELQPGIGFGRIGRIYMRIGWKLDPLKHQDGVKPIGSTGMFTGITPRWDDWDG